MYTTIEADIENGVVRSRDAARLPMRAHVLITLLPDARQETDPANGKASARVPDAAIRGRVQVLGNILDSAPLASWNLPA